MTDATARYNKAIGEAVWYAVANDLIGGWAVCTVDKPLSSLEGHGVEYYVVADTITREAAVYIADMHNERQYGL